MQKTALSNAREKMAPILKAGKHIEYLVTFGFRQWRTARKNKSFQKPWNLGNNNHGWSIQKDIWRFFVVVETIPNTCALCMYIFSLCCWWLSKMVNAGSCLKKCLHLTAWTWVSVDWLLQSVRWMQASLLCLYWWCIVWEPWWSLSQGKNKNKNKNTTWLMAHFLSVFFKRSKLKYSLCGWLSIMNGGIFTTTHVIEGGKKLSCFFLNHKYDKYCTLT